MKTSRSVMKKLFRYFFFLCCASTWTLDLSVYVIMYWFDKKNPCLFIINLLVLTMWCFCALPLAWETSTWSSYLCMDLQEKKICLLSFLRYLDIWLVLHIVLLEWCVHCKLQAVRSSGVLWVLGIPPFLYVFCFSSSLLPVSLLVSLIVGLVLHFWSTSMTYNLLPKEIGMHEFTVGCNVKLSFSILVLYVLLDVANIWYNFYPILWWGCCDI